MIVKKAEDVLVEHDDYVNHTAHVSDVGDLLLTSMMTEGRKEGRMYFLLPRLNLRLCIILICYV